MAQSGRLTRRNPGIQQFIKARKHSALLKGSYMGNGLITYTILMELLDVKNMQQLRKQFQDSDILNVGFVSSVWMFVFTSVRVPARRPSGQRRDGRCTAQLRIQTGAASAPWWRPNRTCAPEMPKAASSASSWRKYVLFVHSAAQAH